MAKVLKSYIPPLPYPEVSVAKYILDKLKQLDERNTVMIDCPSGRTHTAKQAYDHILSVAAAFIGLGLENGDVVCFVCPNSDYYAIGLLGVIAAGGIFTACPDCSPYRELYNSVEEIDVKFIVTTTNNLPVVQSVVNKLPKVKKIITISDDDVIAENIIPFSQLYNYNKSQCQSELPKRVDCERDIAALLASSGSTGRPKPIIRTHRNSLNLTIQFQHQELWPLTHKSVHSLWNTFCHGSGYIFLLHSLASGAIAAIEPEFTGPTFVKNVEKYKISSVFLVPSYVVLLEYQDISNNDVSSLKEILCAGSALPTGLARKMINKYKLDYFRQGIELRKLGYGMTEVGFATQVYRSKNEEYMESVGWCTPDTLIKIVDPKTGQLQGPNQVGEVLIKNLQMTPGYLNRPEANDQLFDSEGFLRSGDAGYYDENELLYIVERYKQIIKVEGGVVIPSELECLLLQHEDVLEAAVIGLKDYYYGEIPKGFVVLKENRKTSSEELLEYINGLVYDWKQLKGLIILTEMPKTPLGKINKPLLAQM